MDTVNVEAPQTEQIPPGKVRVYRFKRFGAVQEDEWASDVYATRQAIERFEAELIASTALDVDKSDLDGYGRYHPALATVPPRDGLVATNPGRHTQPYHAGRRS